MRNVLLVVAPGYEAPNALAYAVARAREFGGKLVALAVLDPDANKQVSSTLSNVGFVGGRVREDLVEALEKEQRTVAEMQVQVAAEEARRRGIASSVLIEEGDPSEVCARVVREHAIGLAVLVAERRSWVTRFLSRSAPVRLPTFAGCEIKVMED
jgi:nucleotide-binding universal stress UspA family protein